MQSLLNIKHRNPVGCPKNGPISKEKCKRKENWSKKKERVIYLSFVCTKLCLRVFHSRAKNWEMFTNIFVVAVVLDSTKFLKDHYHQTSVVGFFTDFKSKHNFIYVP